MTVSIKTLSTMTLSIMVLCLITLHITTLSIMALCLITLNITTLSIMTFSTKIRKCHTQHNAQNLITFCAHAECRYAECFFVAPMKRIKIKYHEY